MEINNEIRKNIEESGGYFEKDICEKHGEYETAVMPVYFGPKSFYMHTGCPECAEAYERKEKALENQEKKRLLEELYQKIGIERKYYDASFSNFKPQNETQSKALNACKKLATGELKKIVLLGSNGTGKTHLGSAMVKKYSGKIITAYEMYALYRQCFTGKGQTEIQLINELSSAKVLVIDEFGRTKGSDAEYNFLSVILDKRYQKDLPTMILSNLIRKKDCVRKCEGCSENCHNRICFESWMSDDMLSRLMEESKVITMTGEDYRRYR